MISQSEDSYSRRVLPVPPELHPLLATEGYGDELFNHGQHHGMELVEQFILQASCDAAVELGLEEPLATPRTVVELISSRGFLPDFTEPLRWLLELLSEWKLLSRDGARGERRYHLGRPLPRESRLEIREACLAIEPRLQAALDLHEAAVPLYVRIARGQTTAEVSLLGRIPLWAAFFNNANPVYSTCNQVAARAATARVLSPERATSGGLRVLEVGAGLGSLTEAFCDALAGSPSAILESYEFTEVVPMFRQRAARALAERHPTIPIRYSALDINRPWNEQRPGAPPVDLLLGGNSLHLARDLAWTLSQALDSLRPGGWLVLGECVRPFPGEPVGGEQVLVLLRSYREVACHPVLRPLPGFLAPEEWVASLATAGFTEIVVTPDLRRVRELHPRFLSAALCGRRP